MNECYGCRIGAEHEELTDCPGCDQPCCDSCIGEACMCADDEDEGIAP